MDVSLAISIISGVIAILSLVFSMATFYLNLIRERKQATLEAFNVLQKQALDHLNEYENSQIVAASKNTQSKEYVEISKYIARLEHFSVGVNQRIYCRKTLYELAEGYFDKNIYYKIRPILLVKNKNEDYYKNYAEIVHWMQKRHERIEKMKKFFSKIK